MFKVGDKVRNKVTGDILTVAEIQYEDMVGVGIDGGGFKGVKTGKVANISAWPIDCCELYHDNEPMRVEDGLPSEGDFDEYGMVMFKDNPSDCWQVVDGLGVKNYKNSFWMRTPDWKPRPSLRESCDECEHKECVVAKSTICDLGVGACWKSRSHGDIKPHYINDKPCHEEWVMDDYVWKLEGLSFLIGMAFGVFAVCLVSDVYKWLGV